MGFSVSALFSQVSSENAKCIRKLVVFTKVKCLLSIHIEGRLLVQVANRVAQAREQAPKARDFALAGDNHQAPRVLQYNTAGRNKMSGPLSDIHAPSVMSSGDQPKSAQLDALQLYAKRDGSKGELCFAPH